MPVEVVLVLRMEPLLEELEVVDLVVVLSLKELVEQVEVMEIQVVLTKGLQTMALVVAVVLVV